MRIGKDNFGHSLKMRIDGLAIVSCFLNKAEMMRVYSKLRKMRKSNYKKYRVRHIKNKKGKPYRNALLIMGIRKLSSFITN
jgi:type III secretory pathway component EscR